LSSTALTQERVIALDGLAIKALRDVVRLEAFIRQPQSRGVDLILVGFADSSEINPYRALALSTDRADFVATQRIPRGASTAAVDVRTSGRG
jgi:hypothetical protein